MSRNFEAYLRDIIDCINKIQRYTQGLDFPQFSKDEKTIDAVIRNIEIIGEAVKNIPENVRKRDQQISWKAIAGMRDKLVHDYFGVDIQFVWNTVIDDIPFLKEKIIQLLNNQTG